MSYMWWRRHLHNAEIFKFVACWWPVGRSPTQRPHPSDANMTCLARMLLDMLDNQTTYYCQKPPALCTEEPTGNTVQRSAEILRADPPPRDSAVLESLLND